MRVTNETFHALRHGNVLVRVQAIAGLLLSFCAATFIVSTVLGHLLPDATNWQWMTGGAILAAIAKFFKIS